MQVHGLASGDHARGDGVALHDAAEDVDQNGLDLGVLQHDLEGFGHLLGGSATAHVQEVGRLSAEQLDGVHRGHGQTGTVHQAANVAIQADVGQIELGSLDFGRIFLVQIAQRNDFGQAEQGVGVEVELGIQGDDVALAVAVQRVDFDQRCIGFHVALVELLEHIGSLGHRVGWHADATGDFLGLRIGQTNQGIDKHGDDFFGSGVGHFFDVHAAFAGGNERHFLGGTVGHNRHVVFFLNVCAVFNIEATDFLTFGASLVGFELHAQNVTSQTLDIVNRLGNFDTTALATATGVDLCLDDPDRTTQLLCGFYRFLNCECGNAARHGHTKTAQDFLGLVLMNLHGWSLKSRK